MKFQLAAATLATVLGALSLPVQAQTVGSASLATHRDCSSVTAAQVCDGSGPGQTIVTRSYGGGVGIGGFNSLDIGSGNFAWSDIGFGAFDLPEIRAFTQAAGNVRMNINAFGFQSFLFSGPSGTPFSLTGNLNIVNSSSNPLGGALPGGAIYSQYVGIWNPSVLAGLTTAQELFNALFYADCSTSGVLGFGSSFGDLPGGPQNYSASTSACSAGSLDLVSGQEVVVVAGLQLPVNRGGFADSSATFKTTFDQTLSPQTLAALQAGLTSAEARGVPLVNIPAVPEPATWATMILGFFMAGGLIRRRNLRTAPATA